MTKSTQRTAIDRRNPLYDSGTVRVTLFAGLVIVFSMLLIGSIEYLLTEKEAVKKLKTKDLAYIAQSITAKIDGIISRSKMTSLLLANDPEVVEWVENGEKDQAQGQDALDRLNKLVDVFGYSNSFIVSSITRHYWGEHNQLLGTVSPNNASDAWFYNLLAGHDPVVVNFDYNKERNNTFVFINAQLSGSAGKPIGAVGVGFSLEGLSKEFATYKYSNDSSLWLIDRKGDIYLSDRPERDGQNLHAFLPGGVIDQLLSGADKQQHVLDYVSGSGVKYDLISYPIASADWQLLVQIPRSETTGFLQTIKLDTVIAMLISLVSVIFLFLFVSRRLADPFKRALQLNTELEKMISLRTRELAERNDNIMDSITYAKRIQESILPEPGMLESRFAEHFVIWKPRDLVGGDFYWMRTFEDGVMVAVGDCTGHGVPGAFMTMLAISALNQLAEEQHLTDPAALLGLLNGEFKRTLHQERKEGMTDDGMDLGLVCIQGGQIRFAGAGCSLFAYGAESGLQLVKGDRRSIGYRRTPIDYAYTNRVIEVGEGKAERFYLTTDGFPDQNGGEKDYSFGRSRFARVIESCAQEPFARQQARFEQELAAYMGERPQRDDITVLAFRPLQG